MKKQIFTVSLLSTVFARSILTDESYSLQRMKESVYTRLSEYYRDELKDLYLSEDNNLGLMRIKRSNRNRGFRITRQEKERIHPLCTALSEGKSVNLSKTKNSVLHEAVFMFPIVTNSGHEIVSRYARYNKCMQNAFAALKLRRS